MASSEENMESPKPTPLEPGYKQHRVNLKREAEVEFGLTERTEGALGYYDIEDIVPALRRARIQGEQSESS